MSTSDSTRLQRFKQKLKNPNCKAPEKEELEHDEVLAGFVRPENDTKEIDMSVPAIMLLMKLLLK